MFSRRSFRLCSCNMFFSAFGFPLSYRNNNGHEKVTQVDPVDRCTCIVIKVHRWTILIDSRFRRCYVACFVRPKTWGVEILVNSRLRKYALST